MSFMMHEQQTERKDLQGVTSGSYMIRSPFPYVLVSLLNKQLCASADVYMNCIVFACTEYIFTLKELLEYF